MKGAWIVISIIAAARALPSPVRRVALKKGGVLGGGKQLSLIPKYLSKAQLADPRSTRTSLDFPLWCAEQDVAAQEPDGDGAVEETEDM